MRTNVVAALVCALLPLTASPAQLDMDGLFPSFSDSHTVGLWLFDEPQYPNVTLTDASAAMYDLRLLSGGRLSAGRFGNALRMTSHTGPAAREACQAREYEGMPDLRPVVRPDHLIDALSARRWTCEFWLKTAGTRRAERIVFALGTGGATHLQCSMDADDDAFLLRGAAVQGGFRCPTDQSRIRDGQWHHAAFVLVDGRLRHFLDGREQSPSLADVVAAAPPADTPGLIGVIRTIRVVDGRVLTGDAVNVRVCGAVDFVWGDTRDLGWSEHWRGLIRVEDSWPQGEVDFLVESAGGARLTVDGNVVVDGLLDANERSGRCRLVPGRPCPLALELVVRGGARSARLLWRKPGDEWHVVPGTNLCHTQHDRDAALGETAAALDGRCFLTLGAGRWYECPMDGMLDELRFSDVPRYVSGTFAPASFSRAHGPDPPPSVGPTGPPLLFGPGAPGGPVALGARKHVFIDDMLVESSRDIRLATHPPTLRIADVPGVNSIPDSVHDHDGRSVRFIVPEAGPPPRPQSTNWDGRTFEDPNPDVRPEERFKYAGRDVQRGVYLFVSPDGVHWRRNETIMLPFDPDGGNEIFWDDQRGVYVSFMRQMGGTFGRHPHGRAAAVAETRDIFTPWPFQPQPEPAILAKSWTLPSITGELPIAIEPHPEWNDDRAAGRRGQVYRTRAIKYPWAPDTYYAFVWRLFSVAGDEIRVTELAVSRDALTWRPLGKPWFYDVGWEVEPGFTVAEALAAEGMVRNGEELWTYCQLREGSHRRPAGRSRTVRYVNRLDGFTSLQAGEQAGWLITKSFVFAGDRLEVNVACRGWVRIGLLDDSGDEIAGVTTRECDPITTGAVRQAVTWGGAADLGRLSGRPVRLRVEMQDADLHAFQFTKESDDP